MTTTVTGKYKIYTGRVEEICTGWKASHFDACLCDPPYLLQFMGKEFDKQHKKMSGANEGQKMQAWHERWTREVLRVLKPGAHMLAFGGTRTYHRLASAAEDVGFEVRDMIGWLYGSGFPKSVDISKGVDRTLGHVREKVKPRSVINHQRQLGNRRPYMDNPNHLTVSDKAASREAEAWQGRGTSLKPAHEPILLSMKPLNETYAKNALVYGVAGLNIDGCRIGSTKNVPSSPSRTSGISLSGSRDGSLRRETGKEDGHNPSIGRWPANLILSHHEACNEECHSDCPVKILDEQSGLAGSNSMQSGPPAKARRFLDKIGNNQHHDTRASGGASRFFYCAKVSPRERNLGGIDCRHPTLKPISLTTYLSRLLLPPPQSHNSPRRILVPFSGAGSEIIGALLAGWDQVIGIEMDAESVSWARARIKAVRSGEFKL